MARSRLWNRSGNANNASGWTRLRCFGVGTVGVAIDWREPLAGRGGNSQLAGVVARLYRGARHNRMFFADAARRSSDESWLAEGCGARNLTNGWRPAPRTSTPGAAVCSAEPLWP